MNKRHAEGGGVREGRNENIDDDTRKRAMESVSKLAKGGMVVKKASAKAPAKTPAKTVMAKGGSVIKKGR